MATFRKRGAHQWQAQIRKKGYPLQSKTFDTRAAAQTWARQVEVDMDKDVFVSRVEAETLTLGDLLERYVEEVTPLKRGAVSEAARIRGMLREPLTDRIVATIRNADIAALRDRRLKEVSSGTVKRELGIFSHVFEVARKEWGLGTQNPVRYVRSPPSAKPRQRRLQSADAGTNEEQALLNACREARNPFLLPVVRIALETAMRQGEILRLRWEHIDLNRQTAHLPDTKNGESRTVPLSRTAVETLRALPRSIHGDVFPGLTGEAIKRPFMRARRRAQLVDFRFHDLRHEATTRFFERGLNIMEVAAITGHKDLRMLQRYTHLRAEDLAQKLG